MIYLCLAASAVFIFCAGMRFERNRSSAVFIFCAGMRFERDRSSGVFDRPFAVDLCLPRATARWKRLDAPAIHRRR